MSTAKALLFLLLLIQATDALSLGDRQTLTGVLIMNGDKQVGDLTNNTIIDINIHKNFSVQVTGIAFYEARLISVRFTMDGTVINTDSSPPFQLRKWAPTVGPHTLEVTGNNRNNGRGKEIGTMVVSFNIVNTGIETPVPTTKAQRMKLYVMDGSKEVSPLVNGTIIDIGTLMDFFVKAKSRTRFGTNSGSVKFAVDGKTTNTEKRIPFLMKWDAVVGNHSAEAWGYLGNRGCGRMTGNAKVFFTVIDSKAPAPNVTSKAPSTGNGNRTKTPTVAPNASMPMNAPMTQMTPSEMPSTDPSSKPSSRPSAFPSVQPSETPSTDPSSKPSAFPSAQPSEKPSTDPSSKPSGRPNLAPTKRPTTAPVAPITSFPFFVSAGQEVTAFGSTWVADAPYVTGGSIQSVNSSIDILYTFDDDLYRKGRFETSPSDKIKYQFPVANRNYFISLFFAELFENSTGRRVFSVVVDGVEKESNLDVFAQTGNQQFLGDFFGYETVVDDGKIDVEFTATVGYPFVCGMFIDIRG